MAGASAIEVENLVKVYGDLRAVDGVDLAVPAGAVFSLLGPNGAGKTTTVEILEGLRKPTGGSARVLGYDVVREYDRVRTDVGILPQDFEPFDRLSPREHLRYFASLFGRTVTNDQLDEILSRVRLEARADLQARKLSGGEKRKLGIALSLVGDPEVVFLDEPTTGLDPRARRDLWTIVRGLREGGRTVVLTTHYIEEAEALADDVAIMVGGRIVISGSPDGLISDHTDARIVRLLDVGTGAQEALEREGLDVRAEDGGLIVRAKEGENLSRTFALIARSGASFGDIVTGRPSLEDVFLRVVGGTLEEGELKA